MTEVRAIAGTSRQFRRVALAMAKAPDDRTAEDWAAIEQGEAEHAARMARAARS